MTSRDEETAQLRAELHRLHAQARRDREALDWEAEAARVLRRLVGRLQRRITELSVDNERLRHLNDSLRADLNSGGNP